jgi:hypothetical protein
MIKDIHPSYYRYARRNGPLQSELYEEACRLLRREAQAEGVQLEPSRELSSVWRDTQGHKRLTLRNVNGVLARFAYVGEADGRIMLERR